MEQAQVRSSLDASLDPIEAVVRVRRLRGRIPRQRVAKLGAVSGDVLGVGERQPQLSGRIGDSVAAAGVRKDGGEPAPLIRLRAVAEKLPVFVRDLLERSAAGPRRCRPERAERLELCRGEIEPRTGRRLEEALRLLPLSSGVLDPRKRPGVRRIRVSGCAPRWWRRGRAARRRPDTRRAWPAPPERTRRHRRQAPARRPRGPCRRSRRREASNAAARGRSAGVQTPPRPSPCQRRARRRRSTPRRG